MSEQPTRGPNHLENRERYIQGLADTVKHFLYGSGAYKNCLTCAHFIEHMEMCNKYGQRPPARIIAFGCQDHTDEIPF